MLVAQGTIFVSSCCEVDVVCANQRLPSCFPKFQESFLLVDLQSEMLSTHSYSQDCFNFAGENEEATGILSNEPEPVASKDSSESVNRPEVPSANLQRSGSNPIRCF